MERKKIDKVKEQTKIRSVKSNNTNYVLIKSVSIIINAVLLALMILLLFLLFNKGAAGMYLNTMSIKLSLFIGIFLTIFSAISVLKDKPNLTDSGLSKIVSIVLLYGSLLLSSSAEYQLPQNMMNITRQMLLINLAKGIIIVLSIGAILDTISMLVLYHRNKQDIPDIQKVPNNKDKRTAPRDKEVEDNTNDDKKKPEVFYPDKTSDKE